MLGDCWLLSTCAALAKREDLLHKVLPPDQKLYGPNYTGQIKLRIWQFGQWQEVVIDDKLPLTKKKKYIYAHCAEVTEFWVALIEKAFAKLNGSSASIEGGMPIESMVDLTGGLAERYDLTTMDEALLYDFIRRSFSADAFITCSRKGDWRQAHASDMNGLVQGHAYTITGVYRLYLHDELRHLVRVRNPWGDNNEWKGNWSDHDPKWQEIDRESRHKIGLQHKADGEFWMDFFQDFVQEFEEVSICTIGPDFDYDGKVDDVSTTIQLTSSWILGDNAGGSRNDFQLFATNPKFKLTAKHESNQVIISLAQKKLPMQKLNQIGFTIYEANKTDEYTWEYFKASTAVATSGTYINYREVFGRFTLSAGSYVIIPATFLPNIQCDFLLRIFSQEKVTLTKI